MRLFVGTWNDVVWDAWGEIARHMNYPTDVTAIFNVVVQRDSEIKPDIIMYFGDIDL